MRKTMSVDSEDTPAGNPFPPVAVATFGHDPETTIQTQAARLAHATLDSYLAENGWQGNTIAIVGDRGTGKTHLALSLLRSAESHSVSNFYLEARNTFLHTYRRFMDQLGTGYIAGLVEMYYADIVADATESAVPGQEELLDRVRNLEIDPATAVERLSLSAPELLRRLDRTMRAVVSDGDFAGALALLMRADRKDAAWEWLTCQQPARVLEEAGISRPIDSEAAAMEAMGSIAQLHGSQHRKFLLVIDDVEVLWPGEFGGVDTLTGFKALLEIFSGSGALLVLLGVPEFLAQLSVDVRQRLGRVIEMPPLPADAVRSLIEQSQQAFSGRRGLEPFTEEAVARIAEVSGGNARTIIMLSHEVFRRASAEGVPATVGMVTDVAREMPLTAAAEPDARAAEPQPGRPEVHEKSDVDWTTDTPTDVDLLKRDALAEVLAARILETRERHPGTSLLVHVDGEWGSGKSTLLGLLGKRLTGEGLLVTLFDAWQQSRLSPPWWALLTAVRNAIVQDRSWWGRRKLRVKELAARASRSGAPFLLSAILLIVGAGGIGLLVRAVVGSQQPGSELLKVVLSAIAAVGVLWPGARVASRVLLWDSASGARLFEQTGANPMARVAEHFGWLLRQSGKPIVLFIDDLDRCKHDYVVEVLEAVQTLLRDAPGGHRGRSGGSPAAYVVVSADGYWIRQSFTTWYAEFDDDGRPSAGPLGYQFMDKLFQLTVPMPALGAAAQHRFLGHLLNVTDGESDLRKAPAAVEARGRIRAAAGDEGRILAALNDIAEPEIRNAVAVDAVRAVAAPETRTSTEHMLRKFAPLIGSNPREIKLFLNTYSILRAVRTLEGNTPEAGVLALWSVLRVRWPAVADHLQRKPASVLGLREPQWSSDLFPEHLLDAVRSRELRAIVTDPSGPLTEDAIRRCCGAD
ncbi:P-loop NTPase fold protein [Amycolatopsis sp. DG1A-15b]|uniref:P-loop NTPase fold protein n=1 Tax=Amycolatopsis sp. DG1A-15b TaxID=3052846 RepID=UPI00255B5929|nr:P-loop NTPase fold protein [Amycolatopsis sp. DG1A-15b]WIX91806.1 P-loop NTPase fold protein [Amycolatopsis sp. DG1A-15b]